MRIADAEHDQVCSQEREWPPRWLARESHDNTELHIAIVHKETERALELIESISVDELNKQSLKNTPLMLSLKKGNFRVARAILGKPNIDVSIRDERGLTALHWAAIHRVDDIIISLIDRGAQLYDEENCNHAGCENTPEAMLKHTYSPRLLYQLNIMPFYFSNYLGDALYVHDSSLYTYAVDQASDLARLKKRYKNPATNGSSDDERMPVFFNDKHVGIMQAMAYSDIIFHIADICQNRGWLNSSMQSKLDNIAKSERCSQNVFRNSFAVCYAQFVHERNHLPVNTDTLQRLSENFTPTLEL